MPVLGKADLGGGVGQKKRVTTDMSAVFERVSGYDISDGSLRPGKMVANITSGAPLAGPIPQQAPAAFRAAGTTRVICRDQDEQIRELVAGAWSAARGKVEIIEDSTPARLGRQLMIPSKDDILVFEPEAPESGTQIRPLSLRCPTDYVSGAKPAVILSEFAGVPLFDCDSGGDWTGTSGEYTATNTGSAATLVFGTGSAPGQKAFTKSIADANLTSKSWLLIDIGINDDPQLYQSTGVFANSSDQQASGYMFTLYSAADCSDASLIRAFYLPRMVPEGKIHRIAVNVSGITATVRGIGIMTAGFYAAPTNTPNKLTVYSETWKDDWSAKGNWLMPAIRWKSSPWSQILSTEFDTIEMPAMNLVKNPSFENGSDFWILHNGATNKTNGSDGINAHTGSQCIELDNFHGGQEWIEQGDIGNDTPLEPLAEYAVQVWYLSPNLAGTHWVIKVQPKDANNNDVGELKAWTYDSDASTVWRKKRELFTCPLDAVRAYIRIEVGGNVYYDNFRIDDVSIERAQTGTAGSAYILQNFNADGKDRDPEDCLVRWRVCYAGRDLLGTEDYKLMVSNPSHYSEPDNIADPWRTYQISFDIQDGPGAILSCRVNTAGTGYTVGDLLHVEEGTGGQVRVDTVGSAGEVTAVTLLDCGWGYTPDTDRPVTGGTGNGCLLTITTPDAIDHYGDYLTHMLVYRQIYDGIAKRWEEEWSYVGCAPIADSMSFSDIGEDPNLYVMERKVPGYLEIRNSYLSSARYVLFNEGRVWAFGLGYDRATDTWKRPTAIANSAIDKPWAFNTTVTDESLVTDGVELDGYPVNGSEILLLLRENVPDNCSAIMSQMKVNCSGIMSRRADIWRR